MPNKTTKLGYDIVKKAHEWAGRECFETGTNKLYCGFDKERISFKSLKDPAAYCMAWVNEVLTEVFGDNNINYPYVQTASTITFYNNFKKKGIVTQSANMIIAGAVFYRTRAGGGHVGIIIGKNNTHVYTIEANTSCGQSKEGICYQIYLIDDFIKTNYVLHTELFGTDESAELPLTYGPTEDIIFGSSDQVKQSSTKNNHRNYFNRR